MKRYCIDLSTIKIDGKNKEELTDLLARSYINSAFDPPPHMVCSMLWVVCLAMIGLMYKEDVHLTSPMVFCVVALILAAAAGFFIWLGNKKAKYYEAFEERNEPIRQQIRKQLEAETQQ